MHPSELWEGPSILPKVARVLLSPLSLLYAVGWECYLAVYRTGLKRAKHPHSPVLCVGNLVSGGVGKTPVVAHLVEVLRQLEFEVVISASGYGSPRAEAAAVAPSGPLDAREWGDEPALLRTRFPNLPIIVGRRRVLAAELCAQEFPKAVLLLDDGFQHLPLKKDLSIVLDPERPMNRMCLPAGPYREPRWNRSRADLVLPGNYKVVEQPLRVRNVQGAEEPFPKEAALLCALGNPGRVLDSVRNLGIEVVSTHFRPDHDPLAEPNLVSDLPKHVPVLITQKDWVKLQNRSDVSQRKFLILDYNVIIEPAEPFRVWLRDKLHAIQKAHHSR